MRAGQLRDTIQIHRYTSASDDFGQQSKTYTLLKTVRAEVKPTRERELITAGKYEGQTQYTIKTRNTDVDKKDRIVWDGKNLEIIEVVDPSNRNTQRIIKAIVDE